MSRTANRKQQAGPAYVPVAGYWDEAVRSSSFPRRHWRSLASAIGRMGLVQLDQQWQSGRQLIQANGITYNVYGDPQGKERPWPMDPLPLLMSGEEWAFIERAIAQRATLLNTVLADLYGPAHLIQERRLPPQLLFANPNFLRPCKGIVPPRGVFLHSYAADLARSPDGRWWVLNDRTQAPSGTGYALENRLVSARTLPGVFNHCQVRQLTRFFQLSREAILDLAPGSRSTPRVVLLTPGPHNETYFEHSFLARQYGIPLVEGADLTVRDNRVYLKTLGGLESVDLILRRQDDSWCDPLELNGDSVLGVPGLLQALRAGSVAVVNALGSGLLESPACLPFLPALCRELLGGQLLMPSVATWWCGQEDALGAVLDNLDNVVIKPAFPRFGLHPEFPASLSKAEREDLVCRLRAHPSQYVAQEHVDLSTAPTWTGSEISPRHVVLRVFAAWDGSGYTVMPGGLTRVSTAASSLVVTMQLGGGSKDTWVLGREEEPPPAAPRPRRHLAALSRTSSNLPSRVADNLFWLGRYAERLESVVRLVRVLLPALSGEADYGRAASLDTAIHLLTGLLYLPREILHLSLYEQRRQTTRLLKELIYDPSQTAGAGWNLKQLRRVASQLKELLSGDTWRVFQRLEFDLARTPASNLDQRLDREMTLLDEAVMSISAFSGLLMENTTRGHGWRFLDIGRRIERGVQLCEWLRCGLASAPAAAEPHLELLLRLADSSITYRTRNLAAPQAGLVLDLLLADESNPRSLGFQVATLSELVSNLPRLDPSGRIGVEQKIVLKALTAIRLARIDDLADPGPSGQRAELSAMLDALRSDLLELSEELTAGYLSHLLPLRMMASS